MILSKVAAVESMQKALSVDGFNDRSTIFGRLAMRFFAIVLISGPVLAYGSITEKCSVKSLQAEAEVNRIVDELPILPPAYGSKLDLQLQLDMARLWMPMAKCMVDAIKKQYGTRMDDRTFNGFSKLTKDIRVQLAPEIAATDARLAFLELRKASCAKRFRNVDDYHDCMRPYASTAIEEAGKQEIFKSISLSDFNFGSLKKLERLGVKTTSSVNEYYQGELKKWQTEMDHLQNAAVKDPVAQPPAPPPSQPAATG